MVKIIDGKLIASRIKDQLAQEIYKLPGPRPNLAIILVGQRTDSKLYVSIKEKEGIKVGIDTSLYVLAEKVSELRILEIIDFLNKDKTIDGILVQLPLPGHLNTNKIIEAIDPDKDVDGFHPHHPDYIVSPVIASIKTCLDEIKFVSRGKQAGILYHADIFGTSVKKMLEELGFIVTLGGDSRQDDLLITALGQPKSIKKEMIKKGAVLIDIGITTTKKGVLGDVDFNSVKDRASYLTPVPGGIGPLTIAFLFKNVFEIYKRKR